MKKQNYFLLLGLMLLAFGLNAQQSSTYCNNRFGFCVNYPASLKQSADEPVNGDGISLEEKDGIKVSISGSFNVMNWTPERIYEFTVEDLSADLGPKVKPINSKVDENGSEARFSNQTTYEYVRMWNQGDTYLVITVTGTQSQLEKIEVLKDQMTASFGS